MQPDFYNHITVPSSGYYFYSLNNFINFVQVSDSVSSQTSVVCDLIVVGLEQVSANINSEFSVSSSANITAQISESSQAQFSVTSAIHLTAVVQSGIDVSTSTDVTSSIIVVHVLNAGIIVNVVTEASSTVTLFLPISSSIDLLSGVNIYAIERFSESLIEDSFNIKPFFILDDLPLSEHNRVTSFLTEILSTSNSNWKGTKSVYYKKDGVKRTFSFQWRMLPGKRENTVDNNLGRNGISVKASEPFVHTLEIKNLDTDGANSYTTEMYNVLVAEYNETLIRRDLVGNDYYWDCNLNLKEV